MGNLRMVKLSEISASGMTLELAEPLVIEPQFYGQEVILEWSLFNIVASGESIEDAISILEDIFVWLWKEYNIDDSLLTIDAQQLKRNLLSMVKGVKNDQRNE